jgi:lipopolysaccharide/colanic/teichoic acid biosynthesis glycosyltransferase
VGKRLFDLALALPLLMLSLPVLVVIAILIKLESPGPVFYLSERVGQGGRLYRPYRFRTMRPGEPARMLPEDSLTRVGRVARSISLDHLPTLLNVVRGEMSLVGPRPMEPKRVELEDPAWQRILTVKPGLVSWAIHCLGREYNATSLEFKKRLELEYVDRQSTQFDLWLLWSAGWALITSRGNVKARGRPLRGLDARQKSQASDGGEG